MEKNYRLANIKQTRFFCEKYHTRLKVCDYLIINARFDLT